MIDNSNTLPRILVVGDVMLDVNEYGKVSRISPEAAVPIHNFKEKKYLLGGAANVAKNLHSLNCNVVLAGASSKDHYNTIINFLLSKYKINFISLYESKLTTVKRRFWANNRQLFRADIENVENTSNYKEYYKKLKSEISRANIIILSDYSKGVLKFCKEIIQDCINLKKITLVDPKSEDLSIYRGCSVLKPNLNEFLQICKREKLTGDIFTNCQHLCNAFKIKYIIITMSEEGVYLYNHAEKKYYQFRATAKNLFDVTGAGDSFLATLGASLANGNDIIKSTSIANTASGIVVGKIGTSTITWDEINQQRNKAIVTSNELLIDQHVKLARKQKQDIILTNGCFDLVHIGHLRLFNYINSFDGFKILLINSDASISQLKGKNRPINSEDERIQYIQELGIFDLIVKFDTNTPLNLIKLILPNFLVKGGDYREDEIIGAKEVKDAGGLIKLFAVEKGYSSSKLIKKILEKFK